MQDSGPGNVGQLSLGLSAKQTMGMRGVCGRALKPPCLWEGFGEITHADHCLPTGLGKSDRPG